MPWRSDSSISVGRRLAILVVVDGLISLALLAISVAALTSQSSDLTFMRRYVLAPVVALARVGEAGAQLEESVRAEPPNLAHMRQLVDEVGDFATRYRAQWVVVDNPSEDAKRFRSEVQETHGEVLLAQERAALRSVEGSVTRLNASLASNALGRSQVLAEVDALRAALRSLGKVNIDYVLVSEATVDARGRRTRNWVILLGILGILASILLGWMVHQGIAPRIRRLVKQVDRFREVGVYEQLVEAGRDEIAILAHAIDVGIRTIAARDREREQFLAVAAHELKTPVTAILGYAQAALEHPNDARMRERALSIIDRNASRLGRLVEELLLAASARAGGLRFNPKPIDLAGLTRRSATDIEAVMPRHPFELQLPPKAYILADEDLLIHAEWSLLGYAAALSQPGRAIQVRVDSMPGQMRLEVTLADGPLSDDEISRAFAPFAVLQYEGGSGVRYATGLFLCREVARLHGGALRVAESPEGKATFRLELPA